MKTIKRKKGWPKWAKFYAVDKAFGAWVYAKEPHLTSAFPKHWVVIGTKAAKQVRDALPADYKTWRNSLRRIVEPRGE